MLPEIKIIKLNETTIFSNNTIVSVFNNQDSPWSQKAWYEALLNPAYKIHLITINKELAGISLCANNTDYYELLYLTILHPYRNKGLASILLKELCGIFKYIYLEVRQSNLSVQNLYLKHNFVVIGMRKNYYANFNSSKQIVSRENAILMEYKMY